MSDEVAYLIIEPSGLVTFKRGPLETKDAMDIVGGDIEIQAPPRDVDVQVIANPDGHKLGLDANWAATRLIRGSLRPSEFLTGTVIVTGPADGMGYPSSITAETEAKVRSIVADK